MEVSGLRRKRRFFLRAAPDRSPLRNARSGRDNESLILSQVLLLTKMLEVSCFVDIADHRTSGVYGSRMHKGVDGRSTQARRFRDFVASFAAGLGDDACLNEVDRALIRNAAALTVQAA